MWGHSLLLKCAFYIFGATCSKVGNLPTEYVCNGIRSITNSISQLSAIMNIQSIELRASNVNKYPGKCCHHLFNSQVQY